MYPTCVSSKPCKFILQSISQILLLQSVDVTFYFCEASDSPPYILILTNCLDGIGMNIFWVSILFDTRLKVL